MMESEINIDKRVSVLEAEMSWASGTVQDIKRDLETLKSNQFHILEILGDYRNHTDERISSLQAHTDERISSLQAHTDERISSLQAHTDGRISSLQAHTDKCFSDMQAYNATQFVGLHKEISNQTKWMLAVVLGAATLISVLTPVVQKLLG